MMAVQRGGGERDKEGERESVFEREGERERERVCV